MSFNLHRPLLFTLRPPRRPLTPPFPLYYTTDEFFVGIGDINAAFLPKKKELTATPPGGKPNPKAPGSSGGEESEKSNEKGTSDATSSAGATTPPTSPEIKVEDLVGELRVSLTAGS